MGRIMDEIAAMPEHFTLEARLRALPVKAMPCAECVHLRETTNPALHSHAVACGWWDDASRLPIMFGAWSFLPVSEVKKCLPRKSVYGPHDPDMAPFECPQFQSRTKDTSPMEAPDAV